jgi:hypothetical protein
MNEGKTPPMNIDHSHITLPLDEPEVETFFRQFATSEDELQDFLADYHEGNTPPFPPAQTLGGELLDG